MSTRVYESVFEFKDASDVVMARMRATPGKLDFLDGEGKKIAMQGRRNDVPQLPIGGGAIHFNLRVRNTALCRADVDVTSVVFEGASAVPGQHGYLAIENVGARQHAIVWSAELPIRWIANINRSARNGADDTTLFYYMVLYDAILLSTEEFIL